MDKKGHGYLVTISLAHDTNTMSLKINNRLLNNLKDQVVDPIFTEYSCDIFILLLFWLHETGARLSHELRTHTSHSLSCLIRCFPHLSKGRALNMNTSAIQQQINSQHAMKKKKV